MHDFYFIYLNEYYEKYTSGSVNGYFKWPLSLWLKIKTRIPDKWTKPVSLH